MPVWFLLLYFWFSLVLSCLSPSAQVLVWWNIFKDAPCSDFMTSQKSNFSSIVLLKKVETKSASAVRIILPCPPSKSLFTVQTESNVCLYKEWGLYTDGDLTQPFLSVKYWILWRPCRLQFKACISVSSSPQIFGMIFSMMLCCAIKRSRDFVWTATKTHKPLRL